MCVCISHTCLTLNNRFQTKMGCWGSRSYRLVHKVPRSPSVHSCVDFGRGGRHRRRNARRDHVARVVPLSVAAHLMVQRGRRLARCRVDAVTAVGVQVAAECEDLAADQLALGIAVPAWQRPRNFHILLAIMFRCVARTISAIGVKCSAPAVEFVQRDAEQLACPGRRKLPSSDVSEDGVLSRNAPAFACAGVFPHRMITSARLSAWPLPFRPPPHRRRSRPTKYLAHRSQAERLALAEALEATFCKEANTGVYISTSGAAAGDGLGLHATTGPRIPAAMIDRTLGDSR